MTSWLRSQAEFPKIFWKKRGQSTATMAAGIEADFPKLPEFLPKSRLFVAHSFSDRKQKDASWGDFPNRCFLIPKYLHEIPYLPSLYHPLPRLVERIDTPSFAVWQLHMRKCLDAIDAGLIKKIVLARRTTLLFQDVIDPIALLELLGSRAINTTLFSFQISPSSTFLGATPEHLYERRGDLLFTEAIAGTRRRGKDRDEDLRLAQELLNGDKEQREFELVKQFLKERLAPLSLSVEGEASHQILKTTRVQHLHNRFSALLKPSASDGQILERLHPTPAVGGAPLSEALELMNQLENFERGWYAAPLGWITEEGADFAVAIRSALVRENTVDLFAAVGVVKGSNTEEEWEELDHKISTFTELFL